MKLLSFLRDTSGVTTAETTTRISRELVRHSAVYGVVEGLSTVGSLILIPVYTRYLSAPQFGILVVSEVLAAVLEMTLSLGLTAALVRFYVQYAPEDRPGYCWTVWVTLASVGASVCLVLSLLNDQVWWGLIKISGYTEYGLLAIWSAFFAIPSNAAAAVLQARRESSRYGLLTLAQTGTTVLAGLYLVAGMGRGAKGALEGKLLGALVFFLLGLHLLRPHMSVAFSLSKVKESLAFSLPLVPHDMARWALSSFDILIVGRFAGAGQAGIYALGRKVAMGTELVVAAVMRAWVPLFYARVGDPHARTAFGRLAGYYGLGMTVLGTTVAVFATEIVGILATKTYLASATVIPLLVAAGVLRSLYAVSVPAITYMKRTGVVLLCTGGSALLNVALNFLLVPSFGILGAAWGALISIFVMFVVVHWISQEMVPMLWNYNALALGLIGGVGLVSLAHQVRVPDGLQASVKALGIILFAVLVAAWSLRDNAKANAGRVPERSGQPGR